MTYCRFFWKGLFKHKRCFSADPHSSNSSSVSVRRAVEVLPAGHTSHPGRRPPPHEGMALKILQPSCGTLRWFASHIFFLFWGCSVGPSVKLQDRCPPALLCVCHQWGMFSFLTDSESLLWCTQKPFNFPWLLHVFLVLRIIKWILYVSDNPSY